MGAWCTALALHETAHALVACFVSVRVTGVSIGVGARIATFAAAGVPVELRALPMGGATRHHGVFGPFASLRHALIVACGPASNLLSAALVRIAPTASGTMGLVLDCFVVTNVAVGLANLVPLPRLSTSHGPTDGWLLLTEALCRPSARREREAGNSGPDSSSVMETQGTASRGEVD
jgi:Zn-dependent protease